MGNKITQPSTLIYGAIAPLFLRGSTFLGDVMNNVIKKLDDDCILFNNTNALCFGQSDSMQLRSQAVHPVDSPRLHSR